MAVFDDGSGPALYVGGIFQQPPSNIARWDGTSWSSVGPGISGSVTSLAVFDDGSGPALYAGGSFQMIAGQWVLSIARWDGAAWSPVGGGIGTFGVNSVDALAVYDDGSGAALYAGGRFELAGGIPAANIARWDGSTWSALGSGIPSGGLVESLRAFDDGSGSKLFVGGQFLSAGGVAAHGLARWNGSSWLAAPGSGFTGGVFAMEVFDDGSGPALYVGGGVTSAGGLPASRVARWDGVSWSALGSGTDKIVYTLAAHDDGSGPTLYAGGEFTIAGGVSASYLARWNGASWSAPGTSDAGSGTDQPIDAFCVYDDGTGPALYAAGRFKVAGGAPVKYVAKWDGSRWTRLGGGGPSEPVAALAVFDDGSGPALYAGGEFALLGGIPAGHIARWDGTSWSTVGGGVNGDVFSLLVFDDGSGPALYAAGLFNRAGGSPASYVARWDGVSWSAVGGGMDRAVEALAVHDDGSGPVLVAGGDFTIAGGAAANRLATWDGVSWSALDPTGGGLEGRIEALASFDDGSGPALYVGGLFWSTLGTPTFAIGRWNGTAWQDVGPPGLGASWEVASLLVFDDGTDAGLYAGGWFTSIGGVPANSLARWDGWTWSAVGTADAFDAPVLALAAFDDGADGDADLYVGGMFRTPGVHVASWHGCGVLALCSGDGSFGACPCGNTGLSGRGCDNSAGTGGARLVASGAASRDTLVLTQTGELASSLSIFLQGDAALGSAMTFGDGLRCASGALKRLYVAIASGGGVFAPAPGQPSIGQRSATLGDPLAPGDVRLYQVYYRDPDTGFCPSPQGSSFNVGNALRVVW
jgi:hypothetical protein